MLPVDTHPIPQGRHRQQLMGQPFGADQVGLGDDGHRPGSSGQVGDLARQVLIARADMLVRGKTHRDHIDLGPGSVHQIVQPFL